jgi:hypothetical protein
MRGGREGAGAARGQRAAAEARWRQAAPQEARCQAAWKGARPSKVAALAARAQKHSPVCPICAASSSGKQ